MATRAHSTHTPLLPPAGAHAPLLPAGSGKQPGPVTLALAAMRAADPDRIHALRQRIADRIEADIALLDALDGDDEREADFTAYAHDGLNLVGHSSDDEPSLCGASVSWPSHVQFSPDGDDLELDPAESGIGDADGLVEQGFSYGREHCL